MAEPKPLAECREEDVPNHHALVYGRVRVWNRAPSDNHEVPWRWSKTAWWKAMYYPHRGPPAFTGAWGIYAGGNDGYTGPGDAELSHWLPMPPDPTAGVQASRTFKRGRDGCCVHCGQDWIKHEGADCTCPSGVEGRAE